MKTKKAEINDKADLRYFRSIIKERSPSINELEDGVSERILKINTQLSIHELLALEKNIQNLLSIADRNSISLIIEARINNFNDLVQCCLPGNEQLTKHRFKEWFKNLDHTFFIIRANIELFAMLAKEVNQADYSYSERVKRCLLTKIDEFIEPLLIIMESQYKLDFAMITGRVHEKCDNILKNYDINKNFVNYYKYCVKNEFHDLLKKELNTENIDNSNSFLNKTNECDNLPEEDMVDSSQETIENDSDLKHNEEQHLILAFITCTLALFNRSKQKPHKRLIFWHEYMFYTKHEDTIAIDHVEFMKDFANDILKSLWNNVNTRIDLRCEEYVEYVKYGIDNLNYNYCENIKRQLSAFDVVLKKIFDNVYKEPEYEYMVRKYRLSYIEDVVTNDFFKDRKGEMLEVESIRKRISNWNSSIKCELKDIIGVSKYR